MTTPPIQREAARYFWEQADYWRRQGDSAYAERMERRAGEWAAMAGKGECDNGNR